LSPAQLNAAAKLLGESLSDLAAGRRGTGIAGSVSQPTSRRSP
jgi:hypothetical protein